MSPAPKLQIPLWAAQPGRTCDSGKKEKDLIIPLSIKASVPRDIDNYSSALPRHQAGRAADVAARRVEAAFWPGGDGEQWSHETGAPAPAVPDEAEPEASDGEDLADESSPSSEEATPEASDGGDLADESPQMSEEDWPAPDGGESPVSALRRARLRAEGARRRAALVAAGGAGRRLPAVEEDEAESQASSAARRAAGAGRRPPAVEEECASPAAAGSDSPGGAATAEAPAFSARVCGLDGRSVEVGGLHDEMEVPDFCDRVADVFQIPNFAVRLMIQGSVLHMSQPGVSLRAAGVAEGSQLTLVKQWGWSKPDVRVLADLLRK